MLFNIVWSLAVVYLQAGKWHDNEIAKGQAFGEPHVIVKLVGNMLSEVSGMPPEQGYLMFKTTDSDGNHCRMAIWGNGKVTAEMFNVSHQEEHEDD